MSRWCLQGACFMQVMTARYCMIWPIKAVLANFYDPTTQVETETNMKSTPANMLMWGVDTAERPPVAFRCLKQNVHTKCVGLNPDVSTTLVLWDHHIYLYTSRDRCRYAEAQLCSMLCIQICIYHQTSLNLHEMSDIVPAPHRWWAFFPGWLFCWKFQSESAGWHDSTRCQVRKRPSSYKSLFKAVFRQLSADFLSHKCKFAFHNASE